MPGVVLQALIPFAFGLRLRSFVWPRICWISWYHLVKSQRPASGTSHQKPFD